MSKLAGLVNFKPSRGINMKTHDARAVANKILDIAGTRDISLTIMQLVKLVHLSNGWWLSFSNGEPLTNSQAETWQYGPVHPQVYHSFKGNGMHPITQKAIDHESGIEITSAFTDKQIRLMEAVVKKYGKIHAFKLSDKMHEPGTPWFVTKEQRGMYKPISNELIKEHFDELGK